MATVSTQTRPSLLVRVRDHDDSDAWRQFVEAYTPLIVCFAMKRGLQEADAADLAQEVMQKVAHGITRFEYDPQRGTFRSWLYRITRNALADHVESAQRQIQATGDECNHELLKLETGDDQLEQHWESEHAAHMMQWAMRKLKADFAPNTIAAFERSVLGEEKVADVAKDLGLSVGAVYIAKSRALVRLREIMQEVEGPGFEAAQ